VSPDDHALVARLRAGDETAFLALWNAHAARLADVAYRYLRSADAAADVVQQTFIAVWESRETLEVRTSLANFLYGAVRNRATNALAHERVVRRYRERVASEYDGAGFAAHNDGVGDVEAQELAAAVRAIVDALPVRTREIFLMSREDGLAPAEIAVVLNLSPQTVYNQLARAVRALAEGLGGAVSGDSSR
jgi:RNA polymerase sigma-70 factor (ECF subfamily)